MRKIIRIIVLCTLLSRINFVSSKRSENRYTNKNKNGQTLEKVNPKRSKGDTDITITSRSKSTRKSKSTESTKKDSSSTAIKTKSMNDVSSSKRIVGTRVTGAGHHNKRNRSIFRQIYGMSKGIRTYTGAESEILGSNSATATATGTLSAIVGDMTGSLLGKQDTKGDSGNITWEGKKNPVKGRLYARLTDSGKLLFHFPHEDKIISLSTKLGLEQQSYLDPDLIAHFLEKENEDGTNELLPEKWIPIEGIFGIYMLPSGPHLVLITDSEGTYKICGPSESEANNPLINLRRVLSMEIVRIPTEDGGKRTRHNEERRQFEVLRRSLKEHEFYYAAPCLGTNMLSSGHKPVVQDVTHTLQRSFLQWASFQDRKKALESKERENEWVEKFGDDDKLERRVKDTEDRDEVDIDVQIPISNEISSNSVQATSMNLNETTKILKSNDCDTNIGSPDETGQHDLFSLSDTSEPTWLSSWFNSLKSNIGQVEEKAKIGENKEPEEAIVHNTDHHELSKNGGNLTGQSENYEKSVGSWWLTLSSRDEGEETFDEGTYFQRPDSRFFWNEESVSPLLRAHERKDDGYRQHPDFSSSPFGMLLDYTIPVTSAFIGVQRNVPLVPNITNSDAAFSVKYDQLLISRRSKYRAGTRFTKRGADSIGDVANFAETEQICIVTNTTNFENDAVPIAQEIYSHIQTRGSIPLRWSSPTDIKTYRPKVMIGTNPLAQARALRNHLVEQLSLYSTFSDKRSDESANIAFINLIDKHSDQGRLGRTFDAVLDAVLKTYEDETDDDDDKSTQKHLASGLLNPTSVSHIWFDFHAECKKGRWDRLKYLLDDVRSCLDNHGYFCAIPNAKSYWEVVRMQNGVVRTNCMDCLDRTNVVQSMFGRYILYQQFSNRFGLKARTKRKLPLGYNVAFKRKMLTLPWNTGEVSHRLLWADNADAISRLYAGTPALKGDFTRTGKRTKRGALDDGVNSLTRFYLNNFLDADRQEGMDLLTGYAQFDNTEVPKYSSRGRISKKSFKDFFQRERLNTNEKNSRLSLSWVPGDLQSHLRSSALSAHTLEDKGVIVKHGADLSLSRALRDIDRRAMLDDPWWVVESDDETIRRKKGTKKKVTKRPTPLKSSNSGHVVGAVIASLKAPIATAITYLCFMTPGMHAED